MAERDNPYRPPATEAPISGYADATNTEALPPVFVKISSFLFAVFIISPVLLLVASRPSAMFLAFHFTTPPHPQIWVHVLTGLLTFAGFVALAILFRAPSAYDFALHYGIVTIATAVVFHSVADPRSLNWANAAFQYPMLIWFTWHAGTNRRRWRSQQESRK